MRRHISRRQRGRRSLAECDATRVQATNSLSAYDSVRTDTRVLGCSQLNYDSRRRSPGGGCCSRRRGNEIVMRVLLFEVHKNSTQTTGDRGGVAPVE